MKTDLSVLDALETYAHLCPLERLRYYELNTLVYKGKLLFWVLLLGLLAYASLEHPRLPHVFFYVAAFSLSMPVITIAVIWRLRLGFEREHDLYHEREFLRLHSRLTHYDRF